MLKVDVLLIGCFKFAIGRCLIFLRVTLLGNHIREIHLCVRPAFDEAIEVEVNSHHISTYLVMIMPLGDRLS